MISAKLVGIAVILALLIGSSAAVAAIPSQDVVQPAPIVQQTPSLLDSVDSLNRMTIADVAQYAQRYKLPILAIASVLVFIVLWLAGGIGPGALAKSGLRDVSAHHAPMWLFAGLLVFTAWAFAAKALGRQDWLPGGNPGSFLGQARVYLATYTLAAIVAIGMIHLFSRNASAAGLRLRPGDLIIGLACLALAYPVIELASSGAITAHEWISNESTRPIAHDTLLTITTNFHNPWVWALIGAVVIGAPIVEETIYRVFLQTAMLRWFGSPWLAILISATAFTAMHYGFDQKGNEIMPYYSLAPLFVLAVAMGLAFERTRRIGVPIVMHIGFNALNVYFALRMEGLIG